MSGSIVWRLVWKEYRTLRGFWLAMLAFTVVVQAFIWWQSWLASSDQEAEILFIVAMGLTACYGLGCGATAFSGEHESDTYGFLRVLPVRPSGVFWGKFIHAAVTTLLLGTATWIVAAMIVYFGPLHIGDPGTQLEAFGDIGLSRLAILGGLKSIELLAWGAFFSLLSVRPLRAVVLAFLVNALTLYPINWLFEELPTYMRTVWYFPEFFGHMVTVGPRAGVVAVVLIADFVLVSRWFRESYDAEADPTDGDRPADFKPKWMIRRLEAFPPWQRLIWQQAAGTRWMLIATAMTYLFVIVIFYTATATSSFEPHSFAMPLVIVAGMMGAMAFRGDQYRGQFRFFAEQGVAPRRVWWARQVYWVILLLGFVLVGVVTDAVLASGYRGKVPLSWREYWIGIGYILGVAAIVYCSGQLCSLWIRSSILAGFATLILSGLLTMWAFVVWAAQVPLWWATAPIPIVLLLTTWITADDWFKERSGGAARVRKLALLGLPTVFVCGAFIVFRWTEIPRVELEFNTPRLTGPQLSAAKETRTKYEAIAASLRSMDAEASDRKGVPDGSPHHPLDPADAMNPPLSPARLAWLDENRESVQAAIEISLRENCSSADFGYSRTLFQLRMLLLWSARRCQAEGRLDEALERLLAAMRIERHDRQVLYEDSAWWWNSDEYRILTQMLYWAAAERQTAERILRGMRVQQMILSQMPKEEVGVLSELRYFETSMDQAFSDDVRGDGRGEQEVRADARWFYTAFPWERQRLMRFTRAIAGYQIEQIARIRGKPDGPPPPSPMTDEVLRWSETTPLFFGQAAALASFTGRFKQLQYHETARRATQIVLALEAWRAKHGRLPDSLDELSPDFLQQMPLDRNTGEPFAYHPKGSDRAIEWQDFRIWHVWLSLPPGRPFLEVPGRSTVAHRMRWIIPIP